MDNSTKPLTGVKITGYILFFISVVYIVIAFLMKKFLNFHPSSSLYEGMNSFKSLRYLQYFLYFSGIAVFFFFETIMNFLRNRTRKKIKYFIKTEHVDNSAEYQNLNLKMLLIIDYIGFSGFVGFLICGNLYWITIFSVISFFSKLKFFPVHKRNFLEETA
ncbi:MAG: hypothetical protein M1501_00575 [Candidatus Omnitrophica bacterium]|nr:hypothetical protein [Candidatus Omnitrophota bacterium]